MSFAQQQIIPAIRNQRQLDLFLQSPLQYGVLLDIHLTNLSNAMSMAKKHAKKMVIHADLVHGLKNDEYSTEYLCQKYKPYGIISTRLNVISEARKNDVNGILRVFLLDSHALEKTYSIIGKSNPDFIEVLPGKMTNLIRDMTGFTRIPILAGGFIRTIEDVEGAIGAGAIAVTTSNMELWKKARLLHKGN